MKLVPDVTILFRVDGRDKRLEYRKVPLRAWTQLEQRAGFTPQTFLDDGLRSGSISALVALLWLERVQRERNLSYQQVMSTIETDDPEVEVYDALVDGVSVSGRDPDPDDGDVEVADVDPPTGPS